MSNSVIRKKNVNFHDADGRSSVSLCLVTSQKSTSLPRAAPCHKDTTLQRLCAQHVVQKIHNKWKLNGVWALLSDRRQLDGRWWRCGIPAAAATTAAAAREDQTSSAPIRRVYGLGVSYHRITLRRGNPVCSAINTSAFSKTQVDPITLWKLPLWSACKISNVCTLQNINVACDICWLHLADDDWQSWKTQ